jgi:ribose transport system permease protein
MKTAKSWMKDTTRLVYLTMAAVWLVTTLTIRGFNTVGHNVSTLQTAALMGFAVFGQAIVVISGGIDMSVNGLITLASVTCAAMLKGGHSTGMAILASVAVCMLVGAFNATAINFLRVPPIIQTVATGCIIEGGLLVLTNGTPPAGCSDALAWIAKGKPLIVTNAFVLWLLVFAALWWLMSRSRFGRYIYAIGSNEPAARISGVHVFATKYLIYMLSGLCAALSGVMMLGNIGSTYLTIGDPYQLYSIASVVIGGIPITGGKGKYAGTIAGTILMVMIRDILNVMAISAAMRNVLQGMLILVLLFAYAREKKAK